MTILTKEKSNILISFVFIYFSKKRICEFIFYYCIWIMIGRKDNDLIFLNKTIIINNLFWPFRIDIFSIFNCLLKPLFYSFGIKHNNFCNKKGKRIYKLWKVYKRFLYVIHNKCTNFAISFKSCKWGHQTFNSLSFSSIPTKLIPKRVKWPLCSQFNSKYQNCYIKMKT